MKAYKKMKRQGRNHFVVIGHPKALTKYSLLQLEHFLDNLEANDEVTTFSNAN